MIDVSSIFRAPNGTREKIEFELEPESFEQIVLNEKVQVEATLLRVEEGLMMMIERISTSTDLPCVRCQKEIPVPIEVSQGDWLYYEKPPHDYDDENELLFINRKFFEIDPLEPVRQEIFLALPVAPHCEVECRHFDESSEGVKALSQLKDLIKD